MHSLQATPDLMSWDGANALADRIVDYWAARGHKIEARGVYVEAARRGQQPYYVVRSNAGQWLKRVLK